MSTPSDAPSREAARRTGRRVLKFAAGTLLALVAMEGIVRQIYSVTFTREPGFGYIRRTVRYRREGNGLSHWTRYNLRRREPYAPSDPSIIVLGDSFTEALMVRDAEVFPERLERSLRATGMNFQVLNLGFSGTSSADYVAYAPLYQKLFSPRWTVIQLRKRDLASDAWDPGKAHFSVDQVDHRLIVDSPPPPQFEEARDNPWKQRVRSLPSMLLHLGLVRFQEFLAGARAEPPLFRAGDSVEVSLEARSRDDARYPVEEELDVMAKSYGGRVTYLFLPVFDPEHPEATEAGVEQRFEEHCARSGLSCVNLRRVYAEFAKRRRSPYGFPNTAYNAGHMNPEGHRAAAAELLSELSRLHSLGLL